MIHATTHLRRSSRSTGILPVTDSTATLAPPVRGMGVSPISGPLAASGYSRNRMGETPMRRTVLSPNQRPRPNTGKMPVLRNALALLGIALCTPTFAQFGTQPASPFYNINDYGTFEGGQAKCTAAIAKAIDAASARGGGTVFIPAGTYLTGPIHLKSNITLHLDAGAVLKFSTDFADYMPMTTSRYEGTMVQSFCPLITADHAENIAITGRGTLDGQGQAWWAAVKGGSKPDGPWLEAFAKANEGNPAPILKRGFLRPPFFQPHECTRVLVDGVKFTNSPFWTVTPLMCDNVTIRAVTISNPGGEKSQGAGSPNTDGINPDSCTNVHISDCHISVGDDCVTIKSGRDEEGRAVGRPCENITIDNCTMLAGHGGVTIGSEMSGGVRNVTISNCVFDGTDRGIRIKSSRGRGGVIENVRVSNIVMRNIKNEAIHITTMYDRSDPEPVSDRTPIFRDLHFSGITGTAKSAAEILGLAEMPIQNVTFSDMQLTGKTGFKIKYAQGIEIRDTKVTAESGPALIADTTTNLTISNLSTTAGAKDIPLISLTNSKNVLIHHCVTLPTMNLFIQADETSAAETTLDANRTAGIENPLVKG
jgi:polygalacturonase